MIALAQTGEVEKTKGTRETNVFCLPYIWSTNVAQIWRTIDQSDQWTQVDVAFSSTPTTRSHQYAHVTSIYMNFEFGNRFQSSQY
jgi:hypothetical protein